MTAHAISDEARYRLLTYLAEQPEASQRDVARALGISLGKVNYCLRALIRKGWIKARAFKNSHHKAGYMYVLTPRGLEAKVQLTYEFLRHKVEEYHALAEEIQRLTIEVRALNAGSEPAGPIES